MNTMAEPKTGVMDRIREFFKDVRSESAKVSWPTRTELRDSTIVVIVTVIIVSTFIMIIDRILTTGLGLLFR